MMEDDERLKGVETCAVFFGSVLAFGMDHINILKVKELRVMLWYHLGSGKLKVITNKVELVEGVTDFL